MFSDWFDLRRIDVGTRLLTRTVAAGRSVPVVVGRLMAVVVVSELVLFVRTGHATVSASVLFLAVACAAAVGYRLQTDTARPAPPVWFEPVERWWIWFLLVGSVYEAGVQLLDVTDRPVWVSVAAVVQVVVWLAAGTVAMAYADTVARAGQDADTPSH